MTTSPTDVPQMLEHIDSTIGAPGSWTKLPGGWPGDIESALIDAVFSARAVYRSRTGRGIYAHVVERQKKRPHTVLNLEALVSEIDGCGAAEWARRFGNQQLSPGRHTSDPGGPSKAATVRQAASALVAEGISTDTDINNEKSTRAKRIPRRVPGIGYATTNYFLMLLGAPGVKPDRMIHRFLAEATPHPFDNVEAERTITAVAEKLDVSPNTLDHAIWRYESERSRR